MTQIQPLKPIGEPAHAKFSASGSSRWLNCPGSIQIAAQAPKGRSSIFAMEGTAAHWLAEKGITSPNSDISGFKGKYLKVEDETGKVKLMASSSPIDKLPPNVFLIDDEMITAVQVYIDTVNEYRKELPDADEMIEQKLDLSYIRPNMFGTGDYVRCQWMGKLVVIDYKHGKGVPVEVEENPQMMYYGVGAAKLVDFDVEEVILVVVQPRLFHEEGPVRTWTTTVDRLKRFEKELGEGVDRAMGDDPMLNPGKHCKFCPGLGIPGLCTASERQVIETTKADFGSFPIENTEIPFPENKVQLEKALKWIPMIDSWCKRVSAHAENMALAGEKIDGYKLVEKKTNRKFTDFLTEEDVVKELEKEFELKKEDLYEKPKFTSPAKVEKMLTAAQKRKLATLGLIVKPAGAPTLVADTDTRPALEVVDRATDNAQGDFKPTEE